MSDDNVIKIQKNSKYGRFKNEADDKDEAMHKDLVKRLLTEYEYEETHGRDSRELDLNAPELVMIAAALEKHMETIFVALQNSVDDENKAILKRYLRAHQLTLLYVKTTLDYFPDPE